MTLSSETTKIQYDGDGSTVAFPVTFIFWDDADIRAVLRNDTTGVETVWVLATDFTLSGGSGSTGTLTATTAPASGESLTIKSDRSFTQETDLALGGPLPSPDIELALDQNVRLVQQLNEDVSRAILLPESTEVTNAAFPDLATNTEELLRINSAGTGLEGVTLAELGASTLTTPVALGSGGTAADLSSPDAGSYVRINAGGTAMEVRTIVEAIGDLFAKGGDIASASPLVVDTDGHYFDVTGTTGFSAMTVAANRLFVLQFDNVLTMTNGASLDLGGSDITTAAGSRGLFYSTAANVVQLIAWLSPARRPSFFVPATEISPTQTAGCAALASATISADRPERRVLDFDGITSEHAEFIIAFRGSWDLSTVTFQVYWTSAATDTDGVAWQLRAVALADGDAIAGTSYGSGVIVTDNAQSTADDLYVTAESSALTVEGSPGADNLCYFRITRAVNNAADTMAEDARLIGIKLFYTES